MIVGLFSPMWGQTSAKVASVTHEGYGFYIVTMRGVELIGEDADRFYANCLWYVIGKNNEL